MKVFISIAMEGCSGIVSRQETAPTGDFYKEARHWMCWDANAAIEGCLEAGATDIVVYGSTNGMEIPWDQIHPKAKLMRSDVNVSSFSFYGLAGLDETFDVVFFLGQHASHGDPKGVISNSLVRPFRDVHINGQRVGEVEIWTALAGHFGVPVGLLTGDDVICEHAKSWLPQIETAVVKYAIDTYAARCLPTDEAHKLIREAACRATKAVPQLNPFCFKPPVNVEIDLVMPNAAARVALIPGTERVGGTKVKYTAQTYWDAYKICLAAAWLAMSTKDPIPW